MDEAKAPGSNVTSFNAKPPSPPAVKLTGANIQNFIINHVESLHRSGRLDILYPDLFKNYRTMRMRDEDIETIYQINERNEVKVVTQRAFDLKMTAFYRKLFASVYGGEAMSVSQQHATTSVLMQFIKEIEPSDVEIFAWPNENILCWKKLDFKLVSPTSIVRAREAQIFDDDEPPRTSKPGTFEWIKDELKEQCPAWASIIERCGNAAAFMAWVGSVFTRRSRNPQFVYMYGDGGDSKGTILQTFQRILGEDLYHTENLPEKGSGSMRFLAGSLEGKLLWMCPDNGKMDVFTPFMKSVTGGDPLAVEKKGKQTRNAVNHVRVLILSNDRPEIPAKDFARRRIILVPMTPFKGQQLANYEDTLYEERVMFLSLCSMAYDLMPNKMQIDVDTQVSLENSKIIHEDVADAIRKYFVLTVQRKNADKPDCIKDYPHITMADFNDYVKERMPNFKPKLVKQVLVEHFGLLKENIGYVIKSDSDTCQRCILGVRPTFTRLRGEGVEIGYGPK